MKYLTLAHFRHFRRIGPLCSFAPLYLLFNENKANLGNDKMDINLDAISIYKILFRWRGQKTKPIQTQLKPIQSQFKPKQTQFLEAKNDAEFERCSLSSLGSF